MEMSAAAASAVVNSTLLFIANVIVWSSLESSVAISISSCLLAILWLLSSVGTSATENSAAIIRQMSIDTIVLRNALHDQYRADKNDCTDWHFDWDGKDAEVAHFIDRDEISAVHHSQFAHFLSELRWQAGMVSATAVATCIAAALGVFVRPWMEMFLAWIG